MFLSFCRAWFGCILQIDRYIVVYDTIIFFFLFPFSFFVYLRNVFFFVSDGNMYVFTIS